MDWCWRKQDRRLAERWEEQIHIGAATVLTRFDCNIVWLPIYFRKANFIQSIKKKSISSRVRWYYIHTSSSLSGSFLKITAINPESPVWCSQRQRSTMRVVWRDKTSAHPLKITDSKQDVEVIFIIRWGRKCLDGPWWLHGSEACSLSSCQMCDFVSVCACECVSLK